MPFLTLLLEVYVVLACDDTEIAGLFISSVIPGLLSPSLEMLSIYVPPLTSGHKEEQRLSQALERNLGGTPVRMNNNNALTPDVMCTYGLYQCSWVEVG